MKRFFLLISTIILLLISFISLNNTSQNSDYPIFKKHNDNQLVKSDKTLIKESKQNKFHGTFFIFSGSNIIKSNIGAKYETIFLF